MPSVVLPHRRPQHSTLNRPALAQHGPLRLVRAEAGVTVRVGIVAQASVAYSMRMVRGSAPGPESSICCRALPKPRSASQAAASRR